jgi:hypothetical protein
MEKLQIKPAYLTQQSEERKHKICLEVWITKLILTTSSLITYGFGKHWQKHYIGIFFLMNQKTKII